MATSSPTRLQQVVHHARADHDFFFLIPSIPAVLGNFMLPMMIGARDLAFPRSEPASWYIYILRGNFHGYSGGHRRRGHGLDVLHALQQRPTPTRTSSPWRSGVFITGFSSIFTGLNFIVTTHKMRAPGLTWFRLPLFVWAIYATSLIMVLGTPVLAISLCLDRRWSGCFTSAFLIRRSGATRLFQHLFWFYSHPAVYIMILPSMGVVSEVITCFSRRQIFGYHFVAFSSLAIAVLGFLVWGHHMFVSGQSIYAGMVFSC
jgi:cytochrome c oxidase subunit I